MNTLMPFFDWMLAASARASVLTVVVLMMQALLRHHVPARWRYALWLPVLIALLMPVFPESAWSVSSITRLGPVKKAAIPVIEQSMDLPIASVPSDGVASSASMSWSQVLCWTWFGGAMGTACVGLVSYVHTLRRYKRRRQPLSENLQRELAGMVQEVGLRHVPRVWMSHAVPSPAVTGVLRPVLLLPSEFEQTLSPHEARLVLKHELTHIKRGDLLLNALLCLLLALHWFNPLLWCAFFKARLDREAACDAQVLGGGDQVQRVAYGHTLLKVETAFSHHGLSLGFVGIFQRGAALRSRMRSLAARPNQHPLMKATLSLGIALLTFLGITQAATPAPDPKAPHIHIQSRFLEITEQLPAPTGRELLPAPLDQAKSASGVIGTLADPLYQVLIRGLSQRKGVDLLSTPTVTTRSGQQARIELVREFTYPDKRNKPLTEDVGVTLVVTPKVTAGDQIAVELSPKVVEFEGFSSPPWLAPAEVSSKRILHSDGTSTESVSDVEKGEVRESTYDARGVLQSQTVVPYTKPVFTTREAKANVVLTSGHTVAIELQPRIDKQLVEETDEAGRTIKAETVSVQRRCFVFVTATVVDSMTGKPISSKPGSSGDKK